MLSLLELTLVIISNIMPQVLLIGSIIVVLVALIFVLGYNKFFAKGIDEDHQLEQDYYASKKETKETIPTAKVETKEVNKEKEVITTLTKVEVEKAETIKPKEEAAAPVTVAVATKVEPKVYPSLELIIQEAEEEEDVKLDDDEDVEDEVVNLGSVSYRLRPVNNWIETSLKLANDEVKERYSEIKNHLLSYEKVKERQSKRFHSFRLGRELICKITVSGKTIKVYLAIDNPLQLPEKYHIKDVSVIKSLEATPALLRVRSKRAAKYAKDLITMIMQDLNVQANEKYEEVDYVSAYTISESERQQLLVEKAYKMRENPFLKVDENKGEETKDDVKDKYGFSLDAKLNHTLNINLEGVNKEPYLEDVTKFIDDKIVVGKSKVTIRILEKGEEKRLLSSVADQENLSFIKDILNSDQDVEVKFKDHK